MTTTQTSDPNGFSQGQGTWAWGGEYLFMTDVKSTVQVPRLALWALIGTLLVTVMVLVFLLGRMSAQAPSGSAPLPMANAATGPPGLETDRSRVLVTGSRPAQPSPSQGSQENAPLPTPPSVDVPSASAPPAGSQGRKIRVRDPHGSPNASLPGPAGERQENKVVATAAQKAEVQAYLQQVQGVTSGTQDLGDATDFASSLLGQASLGDTSGFDALLSKVSQAQAALAKIHPPAPCAEHYRLVSAQMQSSLFLLQEVKKATVDLDSAALTRLAAQGQTMQAQVRHLETLTTHLKSTYR